MYETSNQGETRSQALKRKYTELNERQSSCEEIYDMLQSRPEEESKEIFARIRSGADAGAILRHIRDGDILLQLALVPETRYRYQFPFIKEMPVFLEKVENPYLTSLVY